MATPRSLPFHSVFLFGLSACFDGSDDRAVEAQQEADQTIREVAASADKQARAAQADADRVIADVAASFATEREEYRHEMATELVELDKKIALIEARQLTADGKARARLDASLVAIRQQHDSFVKDFATLDTVTSVTWAPTRERLDRAWAALKDAVNKA